MPGVAESIVATPGTVAGVTLVAVEPAPAPSAFTARSAIVYAVPFVRPVTVTGEVVAAGLKGVQFTPESSVYS